MIEIPSLFDILMGIMDLLNPTSKLRFYKRLEEGDVIAVVSPASPVNKSAIKKSAFLFERKGFVLRYLPSVFKRNDYLAGDDKERFKDLCEALISDKYKAVIFSRGGYGSMRLLEGLSKMRLSKPRPIFGFSDITALHIFFNKLGWITFHSPNLNGFLELTRGAQDFFFDIVTRVVDIREIEYEARYSLWDGKVEGVLVGGNLSVISSLSGTKYDIDLKGKILFLEDVGEEPYRIDRMLMQILFRKDIRYLKGVVFGHFSRCGSSSVVKRVLYEFARAIKKPVVYGIDVGHIKNNMILPLNIRYYLDASKRTLLPIERVFV